MNVNNKMSGIVTPSWVALLSDHPGFLLRYLALCILALENTSSHFKFVYFFMHPVRLAKGSSQISHFNFFKKFPVGNVAGNSRVF